MLTKPSHRHRDINWMGAVLHFDTRAPAWGASHCRKQHCEDSFSSSSNISLLSFPRWQTSAPSLFSFSLGLFFFFCLPSIKCLIKVAWLPFIWKSNWGLKCVKNVLRNELERPQHRAPGRPVETPPFIRLGAASNCHDGEAIQLWEHLEGADKHAFGWVWRMCTG